MATNEYKRFGSKEAKKRPESVKKDDVNHEMVLKKRRNVNKFGCTREINHMCYDCKIKK